MADNDALSANQRRALLALLAAPNVRAAARQCGLGERTLWRYLADETFKAVLRARQDAALAAATASLTGLAGNAVEVLRAILLDQATTPAVRLRAAISALDQMRKSAELDNLAARVARLEENMAGGG